MGSVKNFEVAEEPTPSSFGRGRFVFTDDYSVFDWGKMPDTISDKGKSLCTMGAFNFERLEEEGIPTHYRGVVSENGVTKLDEADGPVDAMEIHLTRVPVLPFQNGEYDYEAYHKERGEHFLIPLEIVFRNAVPKGSSLRRRRDPEEVGLDRDEWPDASIDLDQPIVEYSTKFEAQDRYLDQETARTISGLESQFDELKTIALEVNRVVTEQAEQVGLSHEDGKIECLYYRGEIQVADVVGTFDENRFLHNDDQISKEFLRQFYKRYDPEWVDAVRRAKDEAKEKGMSDWKSLCEASPEPLPSDVKQVTGDLYRSGTNRYTQQEWFDAPPLDDVIGEIRDLIS